MRGAKFKTWAKRKTRAWIILLKTIFSDPDKTSCLVRSAETLIYGEESHFSDFFFFFLISRQTFDTTISFIRTIKKVVIFVIIFFLKARAHRRGGGSQTC